jgi:riboflavin synthase
MEVGLPPQLRRFVVAQGSITLDGVSLTVARLTGDGVEVSLIPETLERTTLGRARPGSALNLEMDIVARYVERLVQGFRPEGTAPDDDE